MRTFKITFCFFSLCLVFGFLSNSVSAQRKGEIINISKQHKIAFTDLGNKDLSEGDIVRVQLGDGQSIFLKVLESSLGLSKLGFVDTKEFLTDPSTFGKIQVGHTLTRVKRGLAVTEKPSLIEPPIKTKEQPRSEIQLQEKIKENLALEKELESLKNRNWALTQEISQLSLEKHVSMEDKEQCLQENKKLKEIIRQLEQKIKNINETVQKLLNLN